jgi:hypothetical protein
VICKGVNFIELSFSSLAEFQLLFSSILAQVATGGLDQAGIHANTLVDAKSFLL